MCSVVCLFTFLTFWYFNCVLPFLRFLLSGISIFCSLIYVSYFLVFQFLLPFLILLSHKLTSVFIVINGVVVVVACLFVYYPGFIILSFKSPFNPRSLCIDDSQNKSQLHLSISTIKAYFVNTVFDWPLGMNHVRVHYNH